MPTNKKQRRTRRKTYAFVTCTVCGGGGEDLDCVDNGPWGIAKCGECRGTGRVRKAVPFQRINKMAREGEGHAL